MELLVQLLPVVSVTTADAEHVCYRVIDMLLGVVAKAIVLQVKVKGEMKDTTAAAAARYGIAFSDRQPDQ